MHSSEKVAEVKHNSEWMLDELEKEYPAIFGELKYPMLEYRQIFKIPLINNSK